jgi:hypothetical protein
LREVIMKKGLAVLAVGLLMPARLVRRTYREGHWAVPRGV